MHPIPIVDVVVVQVPIGVQVELVSIAIIEVIRRQRPTQNKERATT